MQTVTSSIGLFGLANGGDESIRDRANPSKTLPPSEISLPPLVPAVRCGAPMVGPTSSGDLRCWHVSSCWRRECGGTPAFRCLRLRSAWCTCCSPACAGHNQHVVQAGKACLDRKTGLLFRVRAGLQNSRSCRPSSPPSCARAVEGPRAVGCLFGAGLVGAGFSVLVRLLGRLTCRPS